MKDILKEELKKALKKYDIEDLEVSVVPTVDIKFGHFTTNAALLAFKLTHSKRHSEHFDKLSTGSVKESPINFAKKLAESINSQNLGFLERVEAVNPGFLNFYIKNESILNHLVKYVNEVKYGTSKWGKGKRMVIDYSSPNIAKILTIGNFRNTVIGQAIRNLYDWTGWDSVGDNHLGDWGTQFGIVIAGIKAKGLTQEDVENMVLEDFEKIYVDFSKDEFKDQARNEFAKLEQNDRENKKLWETIRKVSLENIYKLYDVLNVKIENEFGEAFYEDKMQGVIDELEQKPFYKLSEGAKIIEFDDFPPVIVVKSNKTTTYFARDLATMKFKLEHPEAFEPRKSKDLFNLFIYLVGIEQSLHFRQLFKATEMLGWLNDKSVELVHIPNGHIRLKEGKMSTRKGNTVKADDLLTQAKDKALTIRGEKSYTGGRASAFKVGEAPIDVAIGAVKYNDLKRTPERDYIFDWDEALNMEGNSAPYIMYTNARALSVLDRSGIKGENRGSEIHLTNRLSMLEEELLFKLYLFPDVIEKAAKEFAPNQVCTYLFELSQVYNSFYNSYKIIGSENEGFRLFICKAVSTVLTNGLDVLGIKAPKKM